jgi:hypothetical protein
MSNVRRLVPTTAALALAVTAFAAPARAAVDQFMPCHYAGVSGGATFGPPDQFRGVIEGQVAFAYASGRLTCAIHVGEANGTYAGATNFSVTGFEAPVAMVVLPTIAPVEAAAGEPLFVCSTLSLDGGVTLYWDSVFHTWSDSTAVSCSRTLEIAVADIRVDAG